MGYRQNSRDYSSEMTVWPSASSLPLCVSVYLKINIMSTASSWVAGRVEMSSYRQDVEKSARQLVVAASAIEAGHMVQSVCNSLSHFLLSFLTSFPCLLLAPALSKLWIAYGFVCHSCDLSTYSYFHFTVPLPKGNFLSSLVDPPGRENLIVLACLFTPSTDEHTILYPFYGLINNSRIRGMVWFKIWLLRQWGFGVKRFPLETVWAGRQATISIL